MIVNFVDLKGGVKQKNISRDKIIMAALKELLLSHDSLYRSVFPNPPANPSWDIAAKNARRVYEAMKNNRPFPKLTIEVEFYG